MAWPREYLCGQGLGANAVSVQFTEGYVECGSKAREASQKVIPGLRVALHLKPCSRGAKPGRPV
jgi:hypothetical protein